MARSINMPFIPGTLKKVREITGCTEEEAANRVKKDVDTIRRWESEAHDELPSLAQAKILANLYRYSAGVFLLEQLPDFIRVPDVHDFRTIPNGESMGSTSWSRNLRYLIRQMQSRQEFAVDAIKRAESSYQPWVGSIDRDRTSAEELAIKMRELLAVKRDEPPVVGGIANVLKGWIRRYEQRAGIFVFQTDNVKIPIEVDEMRGLSMADRHAPFIVLNSKDIRAGRIFTLFHEFAHLWLGASGISASNGTDFMGRLSSNEEIERYCDVAATNALLPAEEFLRAWNSVASGDAADNAGSIADRFCVSRQLAITRALNLGAMELDTFSELRETIAEIRDVNGRTPSGTGGNYYGTLIGNEGAKFVDLVLGEYSADGITIKEAARLLDTKIPSVFSLAEHVGFKL